jgi:ABC-type dipeptide/oligopeptide/nickel transport system ATPase component
MGKEERRQCAVEALSQVELVNPQLVYNKYPHELSGGMRQRVMIASAIICEPKLLIADEPTTALDVTIQLQIVKLLRRLNKEKNMAILFISHDLSLVKRLCERVVVMHDGSMVETGRTEEIFRNPKEGYTRELVKAIPKLEKLKDIE